MKATILSGLIAVALGAFTTSCSNILEESGLPNTTAQSGMGELLINLTTDGALNVSTKADVGITLSDEEKTKFVISGTKDGKSVDLGTFADYVNEQTKTVPKGTYSSITAIYTSMKDGAVLAFDSPEFQGSTIKPVQVEANKEAPASITATLTNSIITVSNIKDLTSTANITELFVYAGDAEPNSDDGKFSLLSGQNTLNTTQKLYVKSGASNIHIVLKGTLKNDNNKAFSATAIIKESGQNATEAAKDYQVSYSLSDENGSLGMTITVNGDVTPAPIVVEPINPYK